MDNFVQLTKEIIALSSKHNNVVIVKQKNIYHKQQGCKVAYINFSLV